MPCTNPFDSDGLARTAYKDGSPSDKKGTETLHPGLGRRKVFLGATSSELVDSGR